MAEIGTMRVKSGLAEMLKGGVIMDVTDADQARIAETQARARSWPRARSGRHQAGRRRADGDPGDRDQEAVTIP
jgi:pyridoxal 5'-phosphate synthase pdxS subunit